MPYNQTAQQGTFQQVILCRIITGHLNNVALCPIKLCLLNVYFEQGFSDFLLDELLVTKFHFNSPPNKLIEYCRHHFSLTGCHDEKS